MFCLYDVLQLCNFGFHNHNKQRLWLPAQQSYPCTQPQPQTITIKRETNIITRNSHNTFIVYRHRALDSMNIFFFRYDTCGHSNIARECRILTLAHALNTKQLLRHTLWQIYATATAFLYLCLFTFCVYIMKTSARLPILLYCPTMPSQFHFVLKCCTSTSHSRNHYTYKI